ncbi:MAG: cytochrome c oxidase assembly protein [Actinomycetota bacterium]
MISLALSLPESGPTISALTTVSKFFGVASSIAVVGGLLSLGFFLEEKEGKLQSEALTLKRTISISAIVWAVAQAFNIVFTVANILGTSLSEALSLTTLRSFVTQITLGQYMFFQLCLAIVVALWIPRLAGVGASIFLLFLTIVAIIAPVFQSHASSSGSHALAIGSLVIHVIAISLWVGGVFAVSIASVESRLRVVPRFSQLALWAAIAVVVSGSANAWTRLDFASAWHSSYAAVVIAKAIATVGLVSIGLVHRRNLAKAMSSVLTSAGFAKLISIELSIMIVVLALGSWLSSNQPPIKDPDAPYDPALAVAGLPMPAAPNLKRIFFLFNPDALFLGILIVFVLLYIKGVRTLNKRGDSWPIGRSVAFACGILAINWATSGGFGVYAYFAFSSHMIAHMILGMIAPIFIILSAPITLALRTLPQGRTSDERGIRGTLIAALHSKITNFWVNPVVALLIFDGSLFGLYFTSLFGGMMQSHTGHFLMDLHFLLSGLLFFHVIIGVDPNPRKVPHLVRIVILFAAMSIHAFFSIALLSTSSLLDNGYYVQLHRPWATDLLSDQHLGGSIGWAMGEIPILLALVATFILWMRDDSRETRRIDRTAERKAAMGQPDELAEYNQYLASLANRDKRDE